MYQPCWFSYSNFLQTISSVFIRLPESTTVTIDTKLVKQSRGRHKGTVEYAVIKNPNAKADQPSKVLYLIPGATGESEGGMMQIMSKRALDLGYHVFISNPLAPPDSKERSDLELIDFTRSKAIREAMESLKEQFGSDAEIYAMGFSLGSNHLLRHLGSHKDCKTKCGIKAAVSVSGAFELPATGIELKYTALGIYDQYMLLKIRGHFLDKKFKYQNDVHDLIELGTKRSTLFDFDAAVRAPMLGHKGGHTLYRKISCGFFVPNIETPTFVLTAKDDPITKYKHVPIYEIKQNPNIFLIATPYGGHCEFSYKKVDPQTGKPYYSNYVE